MNYWYWGPRNYTGESVIVLGAPRERLEQGFAKVEPKVEVGNPYAMANEHFTIYLCTQPKRRPHVGVDLADAEKLGLSRRGQNVTPSGGSA